MQFQAAMVDLDPDSLRRRAIDARRHARSALTAELRRQFLELAENFDDLADAIQSIETESKGVAAGRLRRKL
jgi:hypothetical protein